MVTINGKLENVAGKNISQLIESLNFDKTRIAVEINGQIIFKSKYDQTFLKEGDQVEVVSFVGGG